MEAEQRQMEIEAELQEILGKLGGSVERFTSSALYTGFSIRLKKKVNETFGGENEEFMRSALESFIRSDCVEGSGDTGGVFLCLKDQLPCIDGVQLTYRELMGYFLHYLIYKVFTPNFVRPGKIVVSGFEDGPLENFHIMSAYIDYISKMVDLCEDQQSLFPVDDGWRRGYFIPPAQFEIKQMRANGNELPLGKTTEPKYKKYLLLNIFRDIFLGNEDPNPNVTIRLEGERIVLTLTHSVHDAVAMTDILEKFL